MAKAAAWSDLRGKDRPDKPWMNGLPRVIFVGDMGDFFSPNVPIEYVERELIEVAKSPKGRRHIWMILTKQASRLAQFAAWLTERGIASPANVSVGVSVTKRCKLTRLNFLRQVPAAVRFVSAEPVLEVLGELSLDRVSLVLTGGESGPGARSMLIEWGRSVRDQCIAGCVPFFFKQWGGVHKNRTGRMLDDRTWDESPSLTHQKS
jgi:protein gp37